MTRVVQKHVLVIIAADSARVLNAPWTARVLKEVTANVGVGVWVCVCVHHKHFYSEVCGY